MMELITSITLMALTIRKYQSMRHVERILMSKAYLKLVHIMSYIYEARIRLLLISEESYLKMVQSRNTRLLELQKESFIPNRAGISLQNHGSIWRNTTK